MPDSSTPLDDFPGSTASVEELLDLAEAYYGAAMDLSEATCKTGVLSRAPARLCAIHATELFQNAYCRHLGQSPRELRKRLHGLDDEEFATRLKLRKKTALHLKEITTRREYLISRYAPERMREHTEFNRLTATLLEVRRKVRKALGRPVDV